MHFFKKYSGQKRHGKLVLNQPGKLQRYSSYSSLTLPKMLPATISLCVFLSTYAAVLADSKEGAELFQSKCTGCHTIGKGVLVGPDLAGTKSWNDADLEKSVKSMEKSVGSLSSAEVSSLVSFLKEGFAGGKEETISSATSSSAKARDTKIDATAKPPEPVKVEVGSAMGGSELFDGRRSFTNGGTSCSACHSVDGSSSSMGPDLSAIAVKMNEAGLLAACEQTPFKVMKAAYANHKVTRQEALDLVKYFESIKGQKQTSGEKFPVVLCGGAGSLLIMLLLAFGYRNRNSDVRQKLQRRQ